MPMNGKRLALLSLDPNLTGEAWQDAVKYAREQGVSNLDFLRGRLDPLFKGHCSTLSRSFGSKAPTQ